MKTKIEAALDVLFADKLEDLHDPYELAAAFEIRIDYTDHWFELRQAAKEVLLKALTSKVAGS